MHRGISIITSRDSDRLIICLFILSVKPLIDPFSIYNVLAHYLPLLAELLFKHKPKIEHIN